MTALLAAWVAVPMGTLALIAICREWMRWTRPRTEDLTAARPRLDDDDAPTMDEDRCGSIGHAWLTRQHWRSCPRCGAYRRLREETTND